MQVKTGCGPPATEQRKRYAAQGPYDNQPHYVEESRRSHPKHTSESSPVAKGLSVITVIADRMAYPEGRLVSDAHSKVDRSQRILTVLVAAPRCPRSGSEGFVKTPNPFDYVGAKEKPDA